MPDSFTETTSQGFLSRIANSFIGLLLGPVFVIGAIVLLWWNEGRAVYGGMRLQNGARVDGAWIQLLDTFEYRETIQFFFAEEVHSLEFPSPWLKQYPTVYRRSRKDGRADDVRERLAFDEAFSRELRHFYDCITEGVTCLTPPETARLDTEVLTAMFLASA